MRELIAPLTDRGVVCVSGADAAKLLQGLITNDMDVLVDECSAIHAALLSPQGKILFDFFVVKCADRYLLDVALSKTAELVKRLTMYKLRASADIKDVSAEYVTLALWGSNLTSASQTTAIAFKDPRSAHLGIRILAEAGSVANIASATAATDSTADVYERHRIALGIPQGGKDYDFGDAYPHEADFDLFRGVSFTKGCYIGQEVVARMQNKTVVRKRVVKVTASSALTSGMDILFAETPIGRVGSVDGRSALAMVRLDRATEAAEKAIPLTANGASIAIDAAALENYRSSVAARPAAPSFP